MRNTVVADVELAVFPEGIAIVGLLDDALRRQARVRAAIEPFAYEAYPGHISYGYRLADG